jgi:hypothetical protein
VVAYAHNLSYSRSGGRRTPNSRPAHTKVSRPYFKSKNEKKDGGIVQVIEYLPHRLEALGSSTGGGGRYRHVYT